MARGTNGIAIRSDVNSKAPSSYQLFTTDLNKCVLKSEITTQDAKNKGFTLLNPGSYANNQAVKYSDINWIAPIEVITEYFHTYSFYHSLKYTGTLREANNKYSTYLGTYNERNESIYKSNVNNNIPEVGVSLNDGQAGGDPDQYDIVDFNLFDPFELRSKTTNTNYADTIDSNDLFSNDNQRNEFIAVSLYELATAGTISYGRLIFSPEDRWSEYLGFITYDIRKHQFTKKTTIDKTSGTAVTTVQLIYNGYSKVRQIASISEDYPTVIPEHTLTGFTADAFKVTELISFDPEIYDSNDDNKIVGSGLCARLKVDEIESNNWSGGYNLLEFSDINLSIRLTDPSTYNIQ